MAIRSPSVNAEPAAFCVLEPELTFDRRKCLAKGSQTPDWIHRSGVFTPLCAACNQGKSNKDFTDWRPATESSQLDADQAEHMRAIAAGW